MPLMKRASPLLGQIALLLALSAAGAAPLAYGAVHASTLAVLAVIAHSALALHLLERGLKRRPLTTSWLCLPLVAGLALALLQLTPLPEALRELLSPLGTKRVLYVTGALPDLARGLVRPVLSLDPPETALAALRLSSALCVFLVVADRCRKHDARRLAYRALLVWGLALAVVGLGHWLLSMDLIYGAYKGYGGPLSAPLINPNHRARAFGALSLLLLGYAFLTRGRLEAAAFGAAGGLLGVCTLLVPSRGGTLAYVAALGFLLVWSARARGARLDEPRRLSTAGVVTAQLVGLALAGALLVAGQEVLEQLFPTDLDDADQGKFALYRPALGAVLEHWRAGSGNNAFQSALAATLEPGGVLGASSISHPENVVLQTLSDHGVVLGVLVLVLALAVAATLLTSLARPRVLPGAAALLLLVVGDLVDFSLEVGFGVLLAAVALGLAASALLAEGQALVRVSLRPAAVGLALLLVTSSLTGAMAVADSRFETDRALQAATGDERRLLLERALARHPADSHYAYGLAVSARQRRDARQVLSWANRALVLWPGHPDAHTEAARALAALGHLDQALLEYRLAWLSGDAKGPLLQEVAKRTDDVALRRQALPPDDAEALALLCKLLLGEQRLDDADACYGDATALEGASERTRLEWVRMALRREDSAAALERIGELRGESALDGELASLHAQADAFARGAKPALDDSAAVARAARSPAPLQRWRLHTALALQEHELARDILEDLRRHLKEPKERDWLDRQEAGLLALLGDNAGALERWRRVSRRAPKDVRAAVAQARLELKLGLVDEAARTVTRARALAGERRDVKALADEVARAREGAREDRLRGLYERSR